MVGRIVRIGLLSCALLALVAGDRAATRSILDLPGGSRLEIGRVALAPSLAFLRDALVSSALAQDSATIVLDDVRWTSEGSVVTAPRVEVAGSALSKAELTALLDAGAATPWTERLAKLSAQSVVVPVLRVEQTSAGGRTETLYRDLRAGPIVQGRVAALSVATSAQSATGGAVPLQVTYGRMAATEVDLLGWARLYADGGDPAAAPTRLYATFSADDLVFTSGNGPTTKLATIRGRDLTGRALKGSWRQSLQALAGFDAKTASPEARAAAMGAAADLLEGFDVGAVELGRLEVAVPDAKGEGTVRVERMGYDGTTRIARVDRIAFAAGGGRGTLDAVTLSGFSPVATLRAQARVPAGDKGPGPSRGPVLTAGNLHLDGLALDLPGSPAKPGFVTPPVPVKVTLRAADLGSAAPIDGIPTQTRVTLDNLTVALPPGGVPDALEAVADLGYRDLDLSAIIDGRWDPAAREVTVQDVSVSGRDMGAVRFTGTVGGITKDVFDPDRNVAQAALLGATAKALTLRIENGGLFERVVARQAKAQSLTPDALRREYGTAASAGIPAVLGNSPAARAIGETVARFVAKPGRLTIGATTKVEGGLGVAQFANAGSPAAILSLLNVTSAAE